MLSKHHHPAVLSCTGLLTLCALLFTANTSAATADGPNWYQVELILFSQDSKAAVASEDWRDSYDLHYPDELIILHNYEEPPEEQQAEPVIEEEAVLPEQEQTDEAPFTETLQEEVVAEIQLDPSLRKYAMTATELLELDAQLLPAPLELDPDAFLDDGEQDQAPIMDIRRDPFILLQPEDLTLKSQARRLSHAIDLNVLAHIAWRQPAQKFEQANPVLLQAGKRFDIDYEIEGLFTLSENRYLHLGTQLYYSHFTATATLAVEGLDWRYFSAEKAPENEPFQFGEEKVFTLEEPRFSRELTAKLKHKRRIRANELHYIDHPLFGMLVKITPYTVPDPVWEMEDIDLEQLPGRKPLPAVSAPETNPVVQ